MWPFKNKFETKVVEIYKNHLKDNLISIVLFGSRARGDAKETSDYDLFIIAKELPESPVDRVCFIRKPIIAKFEEKIAIIAKTPFEIEQSFPSLFLDLAKDGKILFDKDFFRPKIKLINKIIKEAGLIREKLNNKSFYWRWKTDPIAGWAIDWKGFHALPR